MFRMSTTYTLSARQFEQLQSAYPFCLHLNAFYDSFQCLGTAAATLTYCVEQSPSGEANRFSASQEIPLILRNSQVPAICPYPEPDQSSSCPTSHSLMIYLNIIFPSTPGYSKWPLSLMFSHQNPVCTSLLPYTCYMSSPSNSFRFYHHHNNG